MHLFADRCYLLLLDWEGLTVGLNELFAEDARDALNEAGRIDEVLDSPLVCDHLGLWQRRLSGEYSDAASPRR